MLIFGIDVLIMFCLGVLCTVTVAVICKMMQIASSEGRAAVLSSFITACTMVLCYVIMVAVLDSMMGIYW